MTTTTHPDLRFADPLTRAVYHEDHDAIRAAILAGHRDLVISGRGHTKMWLAAKRAVAAGLLKELSGWEGAHRFRAVDAA